MSVPAWPGKEMSVKPLGNKKKRFQCRSFNTFVNTHLCLKKKKLKKNLYRFIAQEEIFYKNINVFKFCSANLFFLLLMMIQK